MRKLLILLSIFWLSTAVPAAPISYQGQLENDSGPFDGTADMEFRLYDSLVGGSPVGPLVSQSNVQVRNGLFQIELDFGEGAFSQGVVWLEVQVEGTILTPRQEVTAAPLALHALNMPDNGGGESPWVTSGNDIHFSQGNVGIGTSEPNWNLHVVGDSRFDGTLDAFGSVRTGSSQNVASGNRSFAAGGTENNPNVAEGGMSFVGGGENNQAIGSRSFVAGGAGNVVEGLNSFATGSSSMANARSTFAAGRQAEALHEGSFVWSDWQILEGPFQSTGNNQFLVRASGGVGINKNDPESALDVAGTITTDSGVQFPTGSLMTANPVTGGYHDQIGLHTHVEYPLSHGGELRIHCRLFTNPAFVQMELVGVGSPGGSYYLRGTNDSASASEFSGSPPELVVNSGLSIGDFVVSFGLNNGRLITVRGAIALPTDAQGNCNGTHVDITDVVVP
jgi:hypothetical protein